MNIRLAPWWGLLLLAGWLAGCGGGSAYVTRHPRWEYQHYERIAVVSPEPDDAQAARHARLLADRLTTLLAQSGAFTVLSRSEMEELYAEQDLSRLADAVDEGTALPDGQIKIAQALVVPRITDFKLVFDRKDRAVPVYARDSRGRRLLDRAGRPIIVGEELVPVFTHGAEVEASVRVVDAATGKVLFSDSTRIEPTKTSVGSPPGMSPEDMAGEAVREMAVDFYKSIAPTRIKVRLDSDMLILATDYFDGRYDEIKKLPRSLQDFLLVVRDLPGGCERNDFRVAVAAEGERRNLFEEEFTWSGMYDRKGMSYRVPVGPLLESGAEKFVAKLYSTGDPEPKLERKFSLDEGKGDERARVKRDKGKDEDDEEKDD